LPRLKARSWAEEFILVRRTSPRLTKRSWAERIYTWDWEKHFAKVNGKKLG
jgi:hypothetical protein